MTFLLHEATVWFIRHCIMQQHIRRGLRSRTSPPCSMVRHGGALPQRAAVIVTRAVPGSGSPQSEELSRLTQSIVEAEARLEGVFEPGKPMPRASVVTGMRQEVADLKEKLAILMGGVPAGTISAVDKDMEAQARQAFLEVERVVEERSGRNAKRDDGAAIAVLEAENERLRQQATALLMHQQQLEDLVGRLQHERSERLQKGAFNAAQATEAAAQMVAASMLEDVAQAVRGGNGTSLGVGMGSRANGA